MAQAARDLLDSFFQLRERWRQHRHIATELGFAGWEFLELCGDYAGKSRTDAYQKFICTLETDNRKGALGYLKTFHDQKDAPPSRGTS